MKEEIWAENCTNTSQFQGGIRTTMMVFYDLVDLEYESYNLEKYNPERQVDKYLQRTKKNLEK